MFFFSHVLLPTAVFLRLVLFLLATATVVIRWADSAFNCFVIAFAARA